MYVLYAYMHACMPICVYECMYIGGGKDGSYTAPPDFKDAL